MERYPYQEFYQDRLADRRAGKVFALFVTLILVVFGILFIVHFQFNQKYTYVSINGMSMQPTLNPEPYIDPLTRASRQDGVYVEKTQNIDYSDIIIIENVFKDKTIIKRVLAFGGDYVSIVKVTNGDGIDEFRFVRQKENSAQIEVIEEDYIFSYRSWVNMYYNQDLQFSQDTQTTIVYEPNFYSTFSSQYQSKITYVEELETNVRLFLIPQGEIFFMGDNRANSQDSRSSLVATTSQKNVMGKVVEIVRDGSAYEGNPMWQFNRFKGYISVIWGDILRFFGADV